MTPELILATIKAGFDFGTELLKYLQTDQGRALVQQSMNDRASWDTFWQHIGGGLKQFFSGDLFKPKAA